MTKQERKAEVFIKYEKLLKKPIKDFTKEDWKKHYEFMMEIDAINASNEDDYEN